jgi:hypothetical protein
MIEAAYYIGAERIPPRPLIGEIIVSANISSKLSGSQHTNEVRA